MTPRRPQNSDTPGPATGGVQNRIFGSGEMADLTRSFPWETTAVGPIEQWPPALLIFVNAILASRHPMFLWWGKDLVQFYNDDYRPSIREDKHPRALGQKGKECWPEIWHIIGAEIDAVMERGEATWHENQLVPINRNGRLEDVYWTYSYSPARDAEGTICGVLVVCTETTRNVLAKRQLQLEKEQLARLFEQAPAFFAVLGGANHVFELINQPYQELIGPRNVLGRPVREAVPEAVEQGFVALLDRVYQTGESFVGRRTPIHLARSTSDGPELRYLDFVYQPLRGEDGTVSGTIVLGVDVTEARVAEQALMQSEKLAAVGRLASSIAHEINNPLEAIINLVYLAQHAAVSPDTRRYLGQAELELERVSAIANQTLRFYRQSTHARLVTADYLISGTLPLYQGRINSSQIVVETRDRTQEPMLCFDGEIRQVLSNLIGNAIDAMSGKGGRLLVRSRSGTDGSTGRKGLFLTVADTGGGMSTHAAARIFEPFFTTKGNTGTGLGLWISRETVRRHHGSLKVRSRQADGGSGTVFRLFLPVAPEHAL